MSDPTATSGSVRCSGLLFPLNDQEHSWEDPVRAVLYGIAMLYLFLGVNIVADKFMSAIEMIRSKKLRVRVKESGKLVTVTMWNPTIANLTLMALGSSAPEIMLSIVEVFRNGFLAGDLGPSTILGSAAFNLFVIVGLCILTIPSSEVRRIKEVGVFAITVIFSLFSYLWMLFIVQINTRDIIEVWEAGVTLALFPVLICISYLADVGWLSAGGPKAEPITTGRSPSIMSYRDDPTELHDDNVVIKDKEGVRIRNSAGVLTFESDTVDIAQGSEERIVAIAVHRRNGTQGTVACNYSMEPLTAMPDYDYRHEEGELRFGPGQSRTDIKVALLPKRAGERSDCFQIILSNAQGGAQFNPHFDGAEARCLLTVTIRNEAEMNESGFTERAISLVDGTVNIDRLRLGSVTWYEDIYDAVWNVSGEEEEGGGTTGDLILHLISLPWKLTYAIMVPPPIYCGGWVCFCFALLHIAILTAVIIDFAELFGCVCGIEDFITAITFMALGTSMPDLFASITAAVQDEWADASIINVTGSNSVNVFLGIGLPWTMASIYWAIVGLTPTWENKYADIMLTLEGAQNGGVFIVSGDHLSFSVSIFSMAACICLGVIWMRRIKFGGELGGPFGAKLVSFLLLVMLYCFYIGLSVWKSFNETSLQQEILAVGVAACVVENSVVLVGGIVYAAITWSTKSTAVPPKSPLDVEDLPKPEEPPPGAHRPRGPRDPCPSVPQPLQLPSDDTFWHP
mmetsp:Transcript_31737/g.80171  ORF Transcript_31737/g.80171 Transcript_31737/m.80171 type:complete len:738 (-) Transcript_31737:30-2243(-)